MMQVISGQIRQKYIYNVNSSSIFFLIKSTFKLKKKKKKKKKRKQGTFRMIIIDRIWKEIPHFN